MGAIRRGRRARRALLGGGVVAFRHRGRRPAPLPELERALRRTRRGPEPGATLQALETAFARSPDAAGYVRALRDQRYGGREDPPTSAQRRGLERARARRRAASDACAHGGRCPRGKRCQMARRTIDAHG